MASNSTRGEDDSSSISLETTRALASQALALSVQEWSYLGLGNDPLISDSALWDDDIADDKSCFDRCVDRVTSLLVVRVAAIGLNAMEDTHTDLSTSGICRRALMADEVPWSFISEQVLRQITCFVRCILRKYSSTLPFHNQQHAVTVTVSCNKLVDLMLSIDSHQHFDGLRPSTYGLRTDPILLFALIFSALVHDLQHQGVRNAQLVTENYPAALLYNDQSVQEKQSLHIAFAEFLKPDYAAFREVLFGTDDATYRYFRMTVVSAVMSTDLASPEQTVLTKAKWKEAFDQHSRPQQLQPSSARRGSLLSNISMPRTLGLGRANRRGSNVSEMSDVTMQSTYAGPVSPYRVSRRASYSGGGTSSTTRRFSVDLARRRMSGESNYGRRRLSGEHMGNYRRRMSADGFDSPAATSARRRQRSHRHSSYNDDFIDVNDFAVDSLDFLIDSRGDPRALTNASTDHSVNSLVSDTVDSFAVMKLRENSGNRRGSVGDTPTRQMMRNSSDETNESANEASTSLVSFAAESIGMNHKRLDGAKLTRPRANIATGGCLMVQANDDSTPRKHVSSQQQRDDARRDVSVHDEESSFSLTPPSSEDECNGPSIPNSIVHRQGPVVKQSRTSDAQEASRSTHHVTRRASTGMVSSRFGSLADERIDEDRPNHATYRDVQGNSGETVPTMDSSKFRKRLGILRSMDLSGEAIEIFSRGSMGGVSMLSNPWGGVGDGGHGDDEPDYLRASTVVETLLRVADVGHFVQSWENMTMWSSRMFLELAQAHDVERGHDPGPGWFDNQIRIIDSYLKPLALQLDDIGVFGDYVGASFAQNVDDIRSRWLMSGLEWTEAMHAQSVSKRSKELGQTL